MSFSAQAPIFSEAGVAASGDLLNTSGAGVGGGVIPSESPFSQGLLFILDMSLLINMWAFIVSWNKWNCNVRLRICVADFTFHCVLDNCVIFIVVFWDSRSYPTVSGEADQEGSWGYRPPLIQNSVSEASLFLASVWHWLLFSLDTSSSNHESLLWIHVNITCSSIYQWMGRN